MKKDYISGWLLMISVGVLSLLLSTSLGRSLAECRQPARPQPVVIAERARGIDHDFLAAGDRIVGGDPVVI